MEDYLKAKLAEVPIEQFVTLRQQKRQETK
jgi:hypothetical protein